MIKYSILPRVGSRRISIKATSITIAFVDRVPVDGQREGKAETSMLRVIQAFQTQTDCVMSPSSRTRAWSPGQPEGD
jgi:hypothetical protein